MSRVQQTVRFTSASDGVRIAWARSGQGPTLVKAATWLTHLEYDWENPVWSHWTEFLGDHYDFIRYDERGSGLSDRKILDFPTGCWLDDLESVLEAADPPRPFALLGLSGGATPAIEYAVKYPDRVSHLILYGGYALGWKARDDSESARRWRAIIELTELGWGRPEPTFRRLYTGLFLPRGSEEQLAWFDELCRRTTSPETAARLMDCRGAVDVTDLLPRVQVPTLVVHANRDAVIPFESGLSLASEIPGAEFVQLDAMNHILTREEPAWEDFKAAVLAFTGQRTLVSDPVFETLSERETEILSRLVTGRSNAEIGSELFISEKTVRNHLTRLFGKLGVGNRSQAIVFARDHGFRGSSET